MKTEKLWKKKIDTKHASTMYITISMNVWLSTELNTLQIHLKIHLWSMQNQHSHHNVAKFLAKFLHLQPYHYNLKSHLIL
jgi:hypothetical protein